jgi:hypothetical protein
VGTIIPAVGTILSSSSERKNLTHNSSDQDLNLIAVSLASFDIAALYHIFHYSAALLAAQLFTFHKKAVGARIPTALCHLAKIKQGQ